MYILHTVLPGQHALFHRHAIQQESDASACIPQTVRCYGDLSTVPLGYLIAPAQAICFLYNVMMALLKHTVKTVILQSRVTSLHYRVTYVQLNLL